MKKKILISTVTAVIVLSILYMLNRSLALIENDSKVKENSELTYYIDVIYDGKDSEIVTSSSSATAKVYSDYIYVEDKIPDGLTFDRFLTSEDGTIGAVKRSDGSSCPGYVVGDAAGLNYDSTTNTVSFKIKNLQAGCKLTVGIVTVTPYLNGASRKDFYNTASARENYFNVFSNTVHSYIGDSEAVLYPVTYQYIGTVPDGAPELPTSNSYMNGTTVGVENNVSLAGYTFSGWTTSDVTVSGGKFTMPSSSVTFVGSFTMKSTYSVSYTITGVKPDGYVAPNTKSYGSGDDVVVDSLKPGDVINGYRFLGWTSSGLDLSDGIFVMPSSNVSITGTFEQVKYPVIYAFQGVNLPSNADSLLPETVSYAEGERITLADNPVASGYEFLGWYHEDNFDMPAQSVTIYGEWKVMSGTFAPTITKEIVNSKDYYHEGDTVNFRITVTNTCSFAISDVMLYDDLDGVTFVNGTGYTVKSNQYVMIPSIEDNSSVQVNATYIVGNDALESYTNNVYVTGALASNNYELDDSLEYRASATFTVSNISLSIVKQNNDDEVLSGAEYTLYSDSGATNSIANGLIFDLNPNTTYYLKENKAPVGYQISTNVIPVVVNGSGVVSMTGYTVTGSNGSYQVVLHDDEINILPNTGGVGTYIYIIGGAVLIIGSIVGYYIYYKRKEKKK